MSASSGISRRSFAAGLVGAGAFAVAAPSVRSARAEAKITLKLGHLGNEENVWHKASLRFAEEVAARTKGEIEVKIFPNETLGKETDLIKGIQLGTVDFTITGESLQNWAPASALLAVPYAIRDLDHLDKVVQGDIGKEIAKSIDEKTGLVPLAYFARGARELTANRAIKTPDELNGLKLRVPNVPLFVRFWEALGAKPVPMAFSEVFTSLQSGIIEGQENPLALIRSASFFEVQKFVNRTDHVLSWIYLVGGSKKLGRLGQDQQKAIREAAEAARVYERGLFIADEKNLEAELKAKGMTFVEVDKAAFATKAAAAVEGSLPAELKPLYQKILAVK
jgi:tripartite ATP-independent transporter DctP family solute receptor